MGLLFVAGSSHKLSKALGVGSLPISAGAPYTILLKFRPVAALAAIQSLVSFSDSAVGNKFFEANVRSSGPSVGWERLNVGDYSIGLSTGAIALNQWHSAAFVHTADNSYQAYLNNVAGTAGSTNVPMPATLNQMTIGAFAGTPTSQYFDGYLAEIAIIDRVATAAEIADHHFGIGAPYIFGADCIWYLSGNALTPETGAALDVTGVTVDTAVHPNVLNYAPVLYDQIESVYGLSSPSTVRGILFNQNESTEKRVAVFGDSTSSEYGAQGTVKMQAMRSRLHDYNGHTPATGITPPNVALGGAASQKWGEKAIVSGTGNTVTAYTADQLPPGYTPGGGGAIMQFRLATATTGALKMLDHKNDGLSLIPDAVGDGTSTFASGTMIGGKSIIDARAGKLKVRVVALTRSGSSSQMIVNVRPTDILDPLQASATTTENFALFGAGVGMDLNAAPGSCYTHEAGALAELTLPNARYQVQICGTSATAGTQAVLVGAEFISTNKKGCGVDSFSAGGYRLLDPVTDHANCGFVVSVLPRGGIHIALGQNDQNTPNSMHPAEFYEDMLVLIAFLRGLYGDNEMPVVLEAPTLSNQMGDAGSFTGVGKYYPSINRYIAANNINVWAINTPKLTWDEADVGTYTSDGIHPTEAGARLLGAAIIDALAVYTGVAGVGGRSRGRGRGRGFGYEDD